VCLKTALTSLTLTVIDRIALRIDQLLVERGLAASRSQAQRLIAAGVQWRTPPGALPTAVVEAVKSSVEWRKVNKNKDEVPSDAEIVLLDDSESKYVSRGGLKLEGALRDSGVSVSGLRCMDVGQSTGGFTECLLLNGAAEVVGIDVGHGQVHSRVREDERVICIEGVNARELMPDDERIPDAEAGFDVMVGDVSFISLTLVLPGVVPFLKPGGTLLMLVKPQFELQPENIGKNGLVKDPAMYPVIEKRIRTSLKELGLKVTGWYDSAIEGGDGNREFFVQATKPAETE
jgi:23S rRNA (cytidine1920-2'-O)/16S rRNA (cytidine1409-2'-O)-methyltransferase